MEIPSDQMVCDGVPSEVVDRLVARVAELEASQLDEDVEAFVALFHPDATWVTGGGRRLIGRNEIADFTRSVLPGAFAQGSVHYRVELVRALGPDVVMTGVRQTYYDEQGTPTSHGLPTYVWSRLGAEWCIVVGQNTTVPAQRE